MEEDKEKKIDKATLCFGDTLGYSGSGTRRAYSPHWACSGMGPPWRPSVS